MKKLFEKIGLKLLDWSGYQIPVVKPTIIDIPQCKRAISQEKISWERIPEMIRMPNYKQMYERKVKEAMALRIAGDIETFTVRTDEGVIIRADVVYRDLKDMEEKRVKYWDYDSNYPNSEPNRDPNSEPIPDKNEQISEHINDKINDKINE